MECPYCETKNAPGHHVCAGCGAILQGRASGKKAAADTSAPGRPPRSRALRLLAVAVAGAVLGALAGGLLSRPLGVLLGALLGGALATAGVSGRSLLLSQTARARHAALLRRINDALARSEERTADALRAPAPPPQARLDVAARHLLRGEVGPGLNALHTAQRFGAAGAEFENNAGVALASRGNLPESLEMFCLAAGHDHAGGVAPHANSAAVLCETWDDPDASEKALQAVRAALTGDGRNPAHFDRLSRVLCRERRWGEAEAQARQALALAGDDRVRQADARCALGVALFHAGSVKEAVREFGAAAGPGHAHALADLGLLQLLGGEKAEAAPGLQRLRDAARVDPGSAGVQAALGYALCRAGLANEGARALFRALSLRPSLFEPCYNLGKAYADSGLAEVADPYLARAVKMRPQSAEALLTHGAVRVALKRPAQAVPLFEQALALRPGDVSALVGLGVSLALCGRYADAEARFRAADRVDKDSPVVAGHRAWMHLLRDNASLATAELDLALRRDPDRANFHNNLGLAQIALGAPEAALASLQRAAALNPALHAVHYNLGGCHALLKNVDEAAAAWNRAAEHEPTNADCFSNLGAAYFAKGDYDAAMPHFRRALQIRQDRAIDYARLGLTYAKQGVALRLSAERAGKAAALLGHGPEEKLKQAAEKHRQAIAQFDTALELDPGNVVLHSNRGLACFFIGQAERAMQEWTRVTQLDPLYVRRRGKAHQSEFDASQMEFLPLDIPKRALQRPLKTADFLPCLLGGYDADEWELILSCPDLAPLPALLREARALERLQRALVL